VPTTQPQSSKFHALQVGQSPVENYYEAVRP